MGTCLWATFRCFLSQWIHVCGLRLGTGLVLHTDVGRRLGNELGLRSGTGMWSWLKVQG